MALPLKDFRPAIRPHTHKVLTRIAAARGVSMQELGREIIEEYVAKAIHDAKVVLGQDDDNAVETDSHGTSVEAAGNARSGVRR